MECGNPKRLTTVMLAVISAGCMAQTTSAPTQSGAASGGSATLVLGEAPAIVTDFSRLVRENGAAVVNISATGIQADASPKLLWPPAGSEDDPFYRFFGQFESEYAGANTGPSRSLGSGVIVAPGGYILTDSGVIAGASNIRVTLNDGRDFKATVVGNDPASGVALLKIPATNLPIVRIGSPLDEKAGQWVVSIGSPYGLNNTVTAGIVSNMSRDLPQYSYIPLIQTDITENGGDAGSPVFNLSGAVIGIETPVSVGPGNPGGLAFAIPINEAMKVEQQLLVHHKAEHGRLGITIQEVSGPLAQSFGLPKPEGALVSSVEPDGPSANSGLRAGDVILQFNGIAITDSTQFPVAVADLKPGTAVQLAYWRDDATHDVNVVLGRLNEATSESTAVEGVRAPDGLTVRELSPEEQRQAGVEGGVRVEKSVGPAAFAGIEPGDVILMVDNTPVSDPAELRQKVEHSGNAVALLVQRNGERMFVTIDTG